MIYCRKLRDGKEGAGFSIAVILVGAAVWYVFNHTPEKPHSPSGEPSQAIPCPPVPSQGDRPSHEEVAEARTALQNTVGNKFTAWQEKPGDIWVVLRDALLQHEPFRDLALKVSRTQATGFHVSWDFRPPEKKFGLLANTARGRVVAKLVAVSYAPDPQNKFIQLFRVVSGGKVLLSNEGGFWQVLEIAGPVPADRIDTIRFEN